jgi:predicted ester cyclase
MSKEQENKAIVGHWFEKFWGNPADVSIVDELGTPDILVHYPMHGPIRGREKVKKLMNEFREAFPDLNFWGVGDLIAEGDYVVGRWDGGGTHTGPAFKDLPMGFLPAASGRKMKFTGTIVLRIENGKIAEEIGEEGALTALQQLGLCPPGNWAVRSTK